MLKGAISLLALDSQGRRNRFYWGWMTRRKGSWENFPLNSILPEKLAFKQLVDKQILMQNQTLKKISNLKLFARTAGKGTSALFSLGFVVSAPDE